MAKLTFAGWTTDQRFEDWREKFTKEEQFCDEDEYYLSKEIFHHDEDDDLDFKYRYVVQVNQTWWDEKNSEKVMVELDLVVMPESICEAQLRRIASGYDKDFDFSRIIWYDLILEGIGVVKFGDTTVDGWDDVDGALLAIAHIFECMDRLRGFTLDCYVNRIGTTGWDILNNAVHGIDLFQPAFDRHKQELKEAV